MQLEKLTFLSAAFFICGTLHVQAIEVDTCETTPPRVTPGGAITKTVCGTAKKGYRHTINIDGKPVLTDSFLSKEDFSSDYRKWVFSAHPEQETGCAGRIYFIDLSIKPAKVIAFGVKKACNEFHWASWEKKRNVIALKNNVKFTYENGMMTLPSAGEKLWHSIEPPHAGAGLAEEDAVPFAEDVPPPK